MISADQVFESYLAFRKIEEAEAKAVREGRDPSKCKVVLYWKQEFEQTKVDMLKG